MKRSVAFILTTAILMAVFSLCLSFVHLESNPFEYYDDIRNKSISLSTRPPLKNENVKKALYGENGYIVKFKDSAPLSEIYDCVSAYDFKLLAHSEKRIFKLCIDDIDYFKSAFGDMVEITEKEGALSLSAAVNDPLAADQWELDYLDAYEAWDITTGNREVTVAVLDSGVYRMHPDFEGVTILAGYDAVDRVNVVNVDHNGHGTKVISIIAAAANNGQGMAGVGRNISVMPIRVSDYTGYIHSADFIEAVYHAADAGVDVINMSFGGYTYSAMEEAAMEYAASKGCLLVSAAGNKETDSEYAGMKAYPASYSSVISVGAVDENGILCPFSQRNDDVDMVAPGFNVTVANTEGGYEKELGTSFATAYVSAAAALAVSAIDEGVSFTSDQFVSLVAFLNGGKKDEGYGYGAINAANLLRNINMPLVSGVVNGGVYHKNVSVTFNRGTATLDGQPFYSGDSVITSGSHTLTVTDGENELVISFITDNIPLKYDYKEGSSSASISFTRGTATLDGAPYLSGAPITAEGKHRFELTGPYGNKEVFDFKCDFKAPAVFGVENGKVYTKPVYISAERGGSLTLNGKSIVSGTVVSRSGGYTLISSTADGKAKSVINFTLSLKNVSVYNSTLSGSKLIYDETYHTVVLYNSALSGVRVFSKNNLSKTLCFVRTDSGVTAYGFTDESLVLLNRYGVTICNRSAIALGRSSDAKSYKFEKEATAAILVDGTVYYFVSEGNGSTLYKMNVNTGKSTAVSTVKAVVRHLSKDGKRLIAADNNGEILILGTDGTLLGNMQTEESIESLTAGNGYICTNKHVYSADTKEKLFSIENGEKLLFTQNGVLVTDRSVYNLKTFARVAAFSEGVVDAVISESGYVYKSFNNSTIEAINNSGSIFSVDTAPDMLGAAICNELVFGDESYVSSYVSAVPFPKNTDIIDAVLPDGKKMIYAVSGTNRTLYFIDGDKMQISRRVTLRFEPRTLCSDGKNIYVSFKNENLLFSYSLDTKKANYYPCADKFVKLVCDSSKLYALNDKGNLYAFSKDNIKGGSETVIKSQNVLDFAHDGDYLYVYLKPVSITMLYQISTADYNITLSAPLSSAAGKIFAAKDVIAVGNKVYSSATLELLYETDEEIMYAKGKYLISKNGIYRSDNGVIVSNWSFDLSLPMFASDYSYFSIEADHLCRTKTLAGDIDALPTITGISNGAVSDSPVRIEFGYGNGYLDGEPYVSGTPVENGGLHSFVLSLPYGVTRTISFTINASINLILLVAEKNTIMVNESIKLNVSARPLTYGVVDVVYSTDNGNAVVLPDGSVIGAAVGECTITATTADGKHKASTKITVTKGFIEFDSSYFFADTSARIVKGIAAGTDVEAFLAASSQTKGDLAVRGYNSVQVSAGMIYTGMTAELTDIYGNVIDEWHLSVLGDVDGDGYITANDYYTLDKMLSHPESLTPVISAACDVDFNGTVNSLDLIAIKEHLLEQRTISGESIAPSRASNATAHIIMPSSLTAGSSFTATVTLSDMKELTAISGKLIFDNTKLTVLEVLVAGKNGGFYTETPDGLFFFTDVDSKAESAVTLLVVFSVSEYADVNEKVSVSCEKLWIYDGSAASVANGTKLVTVSEDIVPEVLVHNLPDYIFESEVTETHLVFPSATQKIYVSTYPMEMGDIAGETSFGNRLSTAFAVVLTDRAGNITQYNYECEKTKNDSSAPSAGNTEVYKNNNSYIAEITVEGGSLSPAFDKEIREYFVVTQNPAELLVNAIAESVLSVTEVLPYDEESGTIRVKCTAEDGSVAEYLIHVTDDMNFKYKDNERKEHTLWLWLIPAAAVAVALTTVFIYKKKENKV